MGPNACKVYLLYEFLEGMEWEVICVTDAFDEAVDRAWVSHQELDEYRIESFDVNGKGKLQMWEQNWRTLPKDFSRIDFFNSFKAQP